MAGARLGRQFIELNRGRLNDLGVVCDLIHTGEHAQVRLMSSSVVGAIPLLSPTSGKSDYGLIVRPRFDWAGMGSILSLTGWKVVPEHLNLPLLPTSDRRVPTWLLSSIVLLRIKAMLDRLDRRFELRREDRASPRGRIDWTAYASNRLPQAKMLSVPCVFPDLNEDAEMKAGVHYVLRKHLAALGGVRSAGRVVVDLISLCETLIDKVSGSPARAPGASSFERWARRPVATEAFQQGLEGMRWTVEERGFGGPADLAGLPWRLPMDSFFEAYVETIASQLVPKLGGTLKSARHRQTVSPIAWSPPYRGSQKSLVPDVVIQQGDHTIVLDAKYKEHWEELNVERWANLEDELRERHRADLLQVLAYSTLFATERITCCLVYPCKVETWESLRARNALFHQATVGGEGRSIRLILTAVPMGHFFNESVAEMAAALRTG